MQAHAVKTRLDNPNDAMETVIAESIPSLEERSVVVIASKILVFAKTAWLPKTTTEKSEKWELAKKEADLWLHPDESIYQCMLT
jgi:F420-0:gamma-glutamyl ligase